MQAQTMHQYSIRGVTLFEFLLSLILNSILLALVYQFYNLWQSNNKAVQAISEVNEERRLLNYFFHRFIPGAGRSECHVFANIKGSEGELNLTRMSDDFAVLMEEATDLQHIVLQANFIPASDDRMVIDDCKNTEIFTIKKVKRLSKEKFMLTTLVPLSHVYASLTPMHRLDSWQLYTAATDRVDSHHQTIDAFFIKKSEERIAGVSNLHFQYLEQLGSDKVLRSATEVSHWENVVGIKIDATLNATENYPLKQVFYSYESL